MPDYQKSKVYKLYSPSKNLTYIGSTTQTLSQRLSKHTAEYKAYNNDNTKKYIYSFLVLECEDYKIELLEEYACNNRQQLERKEGEYIKNNICVNKFIAGRTKKEWKEDNIEQHIENQKKWYNNNIDICRERNKQYFLNNKAKMSEYYKQYYLKKKAENQL